MIGLKVRLNVHCGISARCRYLSNRLNALDHRERLEGGLTSLPSQATVVICGGGVMGAAVAYHLARKGWGGKTVLIEKERVGSGSRWHSSGLVGAFKPTLAQVRLAQSSIQLLKDLEARGRPTGWKQCGSLLLARTRDRMTVYRRMKSQSVSDREVDNQSPSQSDDDYHSPIRRLADSPAAAAPNKVIFGKIKLVPAPLSVRRYYPPNWPDEDFETFLDRLSPLPDSDDDEDSSTPSEGSSFEKIRIDDDDDASSIHSAASSFEMLQQGVAACNMESESEGDPSDPWEFLEKPHSKSDAQASTVKSTPSVYPPGVSAPSYSRNLLPMFEQRTFITTLDEEGYFTFEPASAAHKWNFEPYVEEEEPPPNKEELYNKYVNLAIQQNKTPEEIEAWKGLLSHCYV